MRSIVLFFGILSICQSAVGDEQKSQSSADLPKLIEAAISEVTPEISQGLVKRPKWPPKAAGLAAWISENEAGEFEVVLVTRKHSTGAASMDGYGDTISRQTMNYKRAFAPSLSCELTTVHEETLDKVLSSLGRFQVVNLSRVASSGARISSKQEFTINLSESKNVAALLEAFFSGFPGNSKIVRRSKK